MKKVFSALSILIIVFLINQNYIWGQTTRWQFISKNSNGSVSYLNISDKSQPAGNQQTWTKEVFPDGSYKITLINWKCREKQFQILEAVNYAPDGKFIDRESKSSWTTIIPDSVSENYFKVVCAVAPSTSDPISSSRNLFAQVIVESANIRETPFAVGTIMQTAEKGTRFVLADPEPVGVWYQVFIPDSSQTGWLHGNTIKIIGGERRKKSSKKSGKNRTVKKIS